MNIIKLLVLNFRFLSFKNLMLNFFCAGIRNKNSLIVCFNNLTFSRFKSSKVTIKDGFLYLNRSFRTSEPFVGMVEMGENSEIKVENTFSIYSGCHIIVLNNAKLNLGSGYINRNVKIRCHQEISIGNNVAISENVTIWDSDAHQILTNESEMTQPVVIGDNVWIGNNVTILKGVNIGNGAIVAAGSLVNKNVPPGCLVAGVPAKVKKENVKWN